MKEISMQTLKASEQGLEQIRYARERRDLAIENPQWLLEASQVLEPDIDWEARDCFADGVSLTTFRRYLYGNQPIKARAFQVFSQVLGLNWEELRERDDEDQLYRDRKSRENLESIETQCCKEIQKPGALVRIKAPEKMGKTWLLNKVLQFSERQGYNAVKLDFRLADITSFSDYQTLLRWMCVYVAGELDLEENINSYWRGIYSNNDNCTRYFQNYLLSNIENPLVLALDNMDLVFEQSGIFNDFPKLIRYWNDEARSTNHNISEIWRKIRLVIVHSTEVYCGMDINSSPLAGVGLTVEPPFFQSEDVLDLAGRYGLGWNDSDINRLMAFIGGSPALVKIALGSAEQQNLSVEELLESAATESGAFRSHLGRHLHKLQQHPELASAFLLCVNSQDPVEIDSQLGFKLYGMGLVNLTGNCVFPSCNLYRQYFNSRLAQ